MFVKNRKKTVGLCVMVVTASLALAGLWAVLATPDTALAHKTDEDHSHGGGGGGKVGGDVSGWIFTKVTFDDGVLNAVISDGGEAYVDGVDRVQTRIGRNFDIRMDFNTHNKKDSIRTLYFPGGFPAPVLPPVEAPPGTPNPCWPTIDGLHDTRRGRNRPHD